MLDPGEPTSFTEEDDPLTPLDESGRYSFGGLEPGVFPVRTIVDHAFTPSFPVGSLSPIRELEVGSKIVSVSEFDYDGDEDLDLAVLRDSNQFTATSTQQVDLPANRQPLSIPFEVNCPGCTIADLDVTINLDIDSLNDIAIDLLSPGGTKVILFNFPGNGDDDLRATFDDEANRTLDEGPAPFVGRYRPYDNAAESPLSAFDGESVSGTWTLFVEKFGTTPGTLHQLDLHFETNAANSVTIHQNDGTDNYHLAAYLPVDGGGEDSFATGDFDGDQVDDVAVVNPDTDLVTVFLSDSGSFLASTTYAVGDNPEAIVAVDLDGDERMDLITANTGASDLSVLENDGSGQFMDAVSLATGGAPRQLVARDLNADLMQDLVVGTVATNELWVYLNDGDELSLHAQGPVDGTPAELIVEDLNQDQSPDIAMALIGPTRFDAPGPSTGRIMDADFGGPNTSSFFFLVSGLSGGLIDTDLTLSFDSFLFDKTITLIHPDGTRVTIYHRSNIGVGMINTTFDDSAVSHIQQSQDEVPTDQTFFPEEPLSVLDGKSPNGVWTVEFTNWERGDTFDSRLIDWSLTLTTTEHNITTFANDGEANFSFDQRILLQDQPGRIGAADIDHDGDVDLAVFRDQGRGGELLLNEDGTLASPRALPQLPVQSVLPFNADSQGEQSLLLGHGPGSGMVPVSTFDTNGLPFARPVGE